MKGLLQSSVKDKLYYSGFASITGRANVGKSTFLNAVIGQKIAITSFRPQTTRNRIVGIKHLPDGQIVFLDTPGIHRPGHKLGEAMVKTAYAACKEVDLILFMVEPVPLREEDAYILNQLKHTKKPIILLINKIDKIKKAELLPVINTYSHLQNFTAILPISALKNDGVDIAIDTIRQNLPQGPSYYPTEMVTDQIERFWVAEVIREKILLHTEQEVPHAAAVEIIQWHEDEAKPLLSVSANIYVERKSQKSIIIGKQGQKIKAIGTDARKEIENRLATKVFLQLWVKVKEQWRKNVHILKEMGYT